MGCLHHTRHPTLWKDSVPLSLRRGVNERGFNLHPNVNLSRFADNLEINFSSDFLLFFFLILIPQQNIAVLPPVG